MYRSASYSGNLWDRLTNDKQKTRTSAAKDISLNIGSEVLTLKATISFFDRLLVIVRPSRESVNLEEVIGMHEFVYSNKFLRGSEWFYHHTTDKSAVIKLVEDLVANETAQASAQPNDFEE